MGILIYQREIKIVASDSLPRLNYNKNAFAPGSVPDPVGSLITASWIWLSHSSQQERNENKKKEKTNGHCRFVQTFKP